MDKIYFTINGERYSLSGSEVSSSTSLNDYLRNYLQLHGTKAMCHEGGCGACVVSVSTTHPASKEKQTFAVNSCLVHILSCHEWDITTIEGVGNRRAGYHAVQHRLASFNGTQCGYCSPGMVMNMYSLAKRSSKLTMQQVENSFGGNICRCTGYRPILDAFKSFANDLDLRLKDKLEDVEDLHKLKCMKECNKECSDDEDDWCVLGNENRSLKEVAVSGSQWYKPYTVQDLFKVLARHGSNSYRLVAGNTGQGVFPIKTEPKVKIDISSIEALKESLTDENLILGAGTTLTELMEICQGWCKRSDFSYLAEFRKHLDLVAHVPVRNIGTIGGNLALKNQHNDFPSDIFLLLTTVGAMITIMNSDLSKNLMRMEAFLSASLINKLIYEVKLPPLSESILIRTYKIMPRAQNAHAIVNAGFLYKLDSKNKVESANIVFGNISPDFTSPVETIKFLTGQELFDDKVLQKALMVLDSELKPVDAPPEPSPECRKALALGLFYKSILSLAPTLNPRYKSGGMVLERGVSKGTQTFETDKSLWPLNKPVPKLEGLTQCSGEVKFSCDVTTEPRSVQVAFVLSEICKGEILSFDAAEALKLPGVVGFFTAADIPGKNSFTPSDVPWLDGDEEILATKILYYGQPIALIAASTKRLAITAAGLVKIKYKKSEDKLVLNVREALKAPDRDRRVRQEYSVKPTDKGTDVAHTLKGSFAVPSQYHFHMETQSCTVTNTSRGLRIRSATQWMDLITVAVGEALAIDQNCVEVIVPRLGGGYGGKGSRSSLIACACALVAYKLNRTATLVMPLVDNMLAIGKRQQCDFDYEVGVNNEGQIQYLNLTSYSDLGCTFNDTLGDLSTVLTTLYDTSRWQMEGYSVLTDKASNTWCRAPGTTEGIALLEHIMERISHEVKKDPTEIRIMHISEKNIAMKEIIASFKKDCDFEQRGADIEKFNKDNVWMKKALKLSIMAYPIEYSWNFPVTVTIYHGDGTITMSHGGIEMGQGINTKVAQVCAYTLKVPLEKVSVKGSDNFTSANAMVTNGSITSDCLAYATVKACQELLARLQPIRADLTEPTWEEVIKAAFNKGINLQASYMTSPQDSLQDYTIYGVCAAEVELDVLTGNHVLRRVDLLEDTGISISPDIDVGQIEGAFMMGLGLWTSEHLIYDQSGRLLTDRTWTYKPPGVKDIPVDFRVSFRRNSPNPAGVLRSKATGEPALVLAVAVHFAIHDAAWEGKKEYGYKDTNWVNIGSPCTVENILKFINPNYEFYKLK